VDEITGRIELRGLRCSAALGEPPLATLLIVDVRLELDLSAVAESDAYADTIDLADLADTLRELVRTPSRLLLETVAVQAARGILQRFARAKEVRLRLGKPEPPGLDASEEAVEVRLARGTYPEAQGIRMNDAYRDLERSEELAEAAETTPPRGREAAIAALRALLEEWNVVPRGDSVVELLEQAAETDSSLLELRSEGTVLDRFPEEPDSGERAKSFVDAVRARLVNI
jgi:dihydroneopterin aldolase